MWLKITQPLGPKDMEDFLLKSSSLPSNDDSLYSAVNNQTMTSDINTS